MRIDQEIHHFGGAKILLQIRAHPESSTLDSDELISLVGPAEYLALAARAVAKGADPKRWLNTGVRYASLRGKVLATIQDLQPTLDGDAYYLFEKQLSAEDGWACLRLFAADDPDASDALALLSGERSRAGSQALRLEHFDTDYSSKASRFLDVALRMKMGPEKSQRLEDMGTIPCGLRKREGLYLVLLFMVTGIICALIPGLAENPKDSKDE